MAQLAMTVRTIVTGKIFTIEFSASAAPPHVVIVRDEAGKVIKKVTHGSGNYVHENLVVSVRDKKHGERTPFMSCIRVGCGSMEPPRAACHSGEEEGRRHIPTDTLPVDTLAPSPQVCWVPAAGADL